jgi:sugar phosphate isomerase/epimerase
MHDIGNKIIATHISDYDFVNERHWLPGEGKVDWQEVIAILTEIGYDGPWLYEMGLVCPKTILRDRDLRYTDLMRNARELFTGQTPTIFSRPKPNLGWWE